MDNPKTSVLFEQWKIMTNWTSGNIKSLSDEDLTRSLGEGKNHGIWILGHLIESEDELSMFVGKGPMLFPHYEKMFGQGTVLLPVHNYPSAEQLRKQWSEVIEKTKR
jgi:hypothetical protein